MTTITLNTTRLANAAQLASNYTINEGIFKERLTLNVESNALIIASTNLLETIELSIPLLQTDLMSDEINIASFSINAKEINKILKTVKTEEVRFDIDIENNTVSVKNGRSRVKVDIYAEAQIIQKSKALTSFTATNELINAFSISNFCIDTNNPKHELNGLSIKSKEKQIELCSTDTRRMMIQKLNISVDFEDLIIPKEFIKTVTKNFNSASKDIIVNVSDTDVFIESNSLYYSCKKINSKYVEYERIIPKKFKHRIEFNSKVLKSLIEETSLFDDILTILIKDNKIVLFDSEKKCRTEDDIDFNDEVLFKINSRYIIEHINAVNEHTITVCINETNLPFMIEAESEKFGIIMPIVMSDKEIEDALALI